MRVVPKKNGKNRLVTDCRPVNTHLNVPSFTQKGVTAVAEMIQKDDILMTVNVKDGFHHILVQQEHRTYLDIYWKQKFYVWRTLCFGVAVALYYFNKILRPVIGYLRRIGVHLAPFVDDLCLLMRKCIAIMQSQLVLTTLQHRGWTPNIDKCDLTMTCRTTFVGFMITSDGDNGPWIKVLPEKIRKLKRAIVRLLHNAREVSVRTIARVAGQCIAMSKAIVPGKLLLRNVYRTIVSRSGWDDTVSLSVNAVKDLLWWLKVLKSWNRAPLHCKPVDLQVETDASSIGWGSWMIGANISAAG